MDRGTPPEPTTVEKTAAQEPKRRRSFRRGPRTPVRFGVIVGFVLLAGCVALVVALVCWRFWDGGSSPLTRGDVDRAVASALARTTDQRHRPPPDAAAAYRAILPSLVTVTTGSGSTPNPTTDTSFGAGVVVSAQGLVLTALHIVNDGGPIVVFFADGTRATARVTSQRPAYDIAVLTPDRLPQTIVPAVLGDQVQVGDEVFAMGNPLGLRASLSAGIVSALDRTIQINPGDTIAGLIQFDAAVNPGNSGGPLLDREGRVVGIVTALANPSEQPYFVGIGFAVPISAAGGVARNPHQ